MSQNAAAWAQQAERECRATFTDPIEIPATSGPRRETNNREDQGDDGEAAAPPHVLLERRRAASSVCSGQGRTLKGRDLRRVRDSVLRMTGFIES
ncbi:protein S40-1-like [Miscanthus floridulus]|uniref:protein S40-1-like n=1 Tax=Miscanthus floridulus TaxID=154761 RepID=UPI003457B8D0